MNEHSPWIKYLKDAASTDISIAFAKDERPKLVVDPTNESLDNGISLRKTLSRTDENKTYESVLSFVKDLPNHGLHDDLETLNGFSQLISRFQLETDDASPDSVVSVLIFGAIQSGIEVPEDFWNTWLDTITQWELTGNSDLPERSWPVLASALAHRHLGSRTEGSNTNKEFAAAWKDVVNFFVESIISNHNPRSLPQNTREPMLEMARIAFEIEITNYESLLSTCYRTQLSLPVSGTSRRRLIDALYTSEKEFAGALKVIARNDRINSQLGEGYGFLCIERPGLKNSLPKYWMTISIDNRRAVNLKALRTALEDAECAAWVATGIVRPISTEKSRQSAWLTDDEQKFDQCWYIDKACSIIGSPDAVEYLVNGEMKTTGSLLTSKQVYEIIARTYNPLSEIEVTDRQNARKYSLEDIPHAYIQNAAGQAPRRIFMASWSQENPLPVASSGQKTTGISLTIFRMMAARTLGLSGMNAFMESPKIDSFQVIKFGSGLAIVSVSGVFLLDISAPFPANMQCAYELAERQLKLTVELDEIQPEIERIATSLKDIVNSNTSSKGIFSVRKSCIKAQANLIRMRGLRDTPLLAKQADLVELHSTFSQDWNLRTRLEQLASEVEWLEQSAKSMEEFRLLRVGKWAAAIALIFLIVDVLSPIFLPILSPDLIPKSKWAEMISFGVIMIVSGCLLAIGRLYLKSRIK